MIAHDLQSEAAPAGNPGSGDAGLEDDARQSHDSLSLGVSPRGTQALYRATQALALCEGREYAIPDDVKRLAVPVFAHRVVINTRVALAQRTTELAERILQEILTQVEVPL